MFDKMIEYLDKQIKFNNDLLSVGNERINSNDVDLVALIAVLNNINDNLLMLIKIKNCLLECRDKFL